MKVISIFNHRTGDYFSFINYHVDATQIEHRNFSATQLRLCLSNFAPATYTNLWDKLTPELQSNIKQKLFEVIYKEADLSMKKHIADTIG